jgi:hypothetical protein
VRKIQWNDAHSDRKAAGLDLSIIPTHFTAQAQYLSLDVRFLFA